MSYDTIKGHTAVKAKLSEIAKIGTDKYPKIFTISFNIIFDIVNISWHISLKDITNYAASSKDS